MTTNRTTAQSEDDFARALRDLAERLGWLTYHTHRSDRSEPGFPDEVMVRGSRLIFAELKRDNAPARAPKYEAEARPEWLRNRAITGPQAEWLAALRVVELAVDEAVEGDDWARAYQGADENPGVSVEVYCWTPADWPEVERVLAR